MRSIGWSYRGFRFVGYGYLASGEEAEFAVSVAHERTDFFTLEGEPNGAGNAEGAGDHDGVRRADAVGEYSGEKAAEGSGAEEGHGVVGHGAGAFIFGDQGLDDGVGDSGALHESEADADHEKQREPESMGEAKADECGAEHGGGDLEHAGEAADGLADGERKR